MSATPSQILLKEELLEDLKNLDMPFDYRFAGVLGDPKLSSPWDVAYGSGAEAGHALPGSDVVDGRGRGPWTR